MSSNPELTDTREFELPAEQRAEPTSSIVPRLRADVFGLSDRGKVRANNEDRVLVGSFGRFLHTIAGNVTTGDLPQHNDERGYGLVVADGMGGCAAGEVASTLAIQTLVKLTLEAPDWILNPTDEAALQEVMRRAREFVDYIHKTLAQQAQKDASLRGFGTTMTLAFSLGRHLFITHIGDSRAYLYRKGHLHRLTRDHTLAQSMADRGLISPNEVPKHRLRHVLTNVLCSNVPAVFADVECFPLEQDDRLLLCTDGLTEMVSDDVIAELLRLETTSESLCRRLIDAALAAGATDNVTVAVARFDWTTTQC